MGFSLSCTVLLFLSGQASHRAALTEGVTELATGGGIPGAMVASGSPGFVVLTGRANKEAVPVAVAAPAGNGRLLAAGHEVFVSPSLLSHAGNGRFFSNGLRWLGKGELKGLRVGFCGLALPDKQLRDWGCVGSSVAKGDLGRELSNLAVLCLNQGTLDGDAAAQRNVMAWVRRGGGLLIVGPAWGWQQVTRKDLQREHSGNQMLSEFGIGFADGLLDGPFTPGEAEDPNLTTFGAIEKLQNGTANIRRAVASVDRALVSMPDPALERQVAKLAASEKGEGKITWQAPFTRLKARLDARGWRTTRPELVQKHPLADDFPGRIAAGAVRVRRTLEMDPSLPGWHSTGIYAAPGEVVTIKNAKGFEIRIGAHTDTLWHLDEWARFPQVSQAVTVGVDPVQLASPFGGLVYIVPTEKRQVTVEGGVEAPLYKLGYTTASEWRQARNAPAPWGDLVGKHISITLPTSVLQKLEEPGRLMQYWDEVYRYCCELYGEPRGTRQERYVPDRQISAGYMHSGYPIMTHDDVAATFADLAKLRGKGSTWGFYHELGHNFQSGMWTFDGTGEVTNNLFSLYGSEMLNGITPATYSQAHPALDEAALKAKLAKYRAAGKPFDQWKADPFLALYMYIQVRKEFGWEPFQRVFALYRTLPASERPRTDDEKRNQWMVRLSRAVGRNLGPFFDSWGVPTSGAAKESIRSLPLWNPEE